MRVAIPLLWAILFLAVALPSAGVAQGAGSRSAAAEAYDRGTAAYLDGNYARAAQWFETANRMSPAAPALMQAVRAHYKAENSAKSASLALVLRDKYGAEPAAEQFAAGILEELAPQLHKVEVSCDDCKAASDGSLEPGLIFFVEADTEHTIDATFVHGTVSKEVAGAAGETSVVEFDAPAPPPKPETTGPTGDEGGRQVEIGTDASPSRKPLPPWVFIAGAAATAGLAAGAVVLTLSGNSTIEDFNDAGKAYQECLGLIVANQACSKDAAVLKQEADDLLPDAESAHTPAIILWVATGVFAAGTVVSLFFTDWSGGEESDDVAFRVLPSPDGAFGVVSGKF